MKLKRKKKWISGCEGKVEKNKGEVCLKKVEKSIFHATFSSKN